MSGFVLHPEALADLNEIWEFIAADSPQAAGPVLEEIHTAIKAVISFRNLVNRCLDLTSRPLRFHAVRDFLIVYAPDKKPLLVVGVLHGRRNPRVIAAFLRNRK
jgi:plasmid stabilization system protein ParE